MGIGMGIGMGMGMGMGQLAKSMDVHQSTASNLVRVLEHKDLIRTDKDEADKRHVHLNVTAPPMELLAKVPGPFKDVLSAALERLNPQTLQRLEQDLAKLIALLQADETAGQLPQAHL